MVLVILAILAAILVPALLGWIDEARNKQYVLEARNVYTASQVVMDEAYASTALGTDSMRGYLEKKVARVEELSDIDGIEFESVTPQDNADEHGKYTIKEMKISFLSNSGDGTDTVYATLEDGKWTATTETPEG